jgi:hypothetical protein
MPQIDGSIKGDLNKRGRSMKNRLELVTPENYRQLHGHINDRMEHFLINSENWVLALFKKIPSDPSPEAIVMLNDWINQSCLSGCRRRL